MWTTVINYCEEVRKANNQDIIFNNFILSCTEEINPGFLHQIKTPVQSSEKSLQQKKIDVLEPHSKWKFKNSHATQNDRKMIYCYLFLGFKKRVYIISVDLFRDPVYPQLKLQVMQYPTTEEAYVSLWANLY